jgi:hypothetical protein
MYVFYVKPPTDWSLGRRYIENRFEWRDYFHNSREVEPSQLGYGVG